MLCYKDFLLYLMRERVMVKSNGGDQKTNGAGNNALAHVARAHNGNGAQTEETEPEIFRSTEFQRKAGQRGRKKEQKAHAHNPTEGGCE